MDTPPVWPYLPTLGRLALALALGLLIGIERERRRKEAGLRTFTFAFFVSAIWALLAVVASHVLHQGALGYGILNGSLGVGALVGATALPRVRRRFSADRIIAAATLYNVITLLILAFAHHSWLIIIT